MYNSSDNIKIERLTSLITPNAPIFTISIISEILRVHQRTLRIYDEEGLLTPKRTEKNRRLYSMEDVERGKFIQYLTRELGVNLAGVKVIFKLLEEMKIKPCDYVTHIQESIEKSNLPEEEKECEEQLLIKRARKPKND